MSIHSIYQRARNLLFQPEKEWEDIRSEHLPSQDVHRRYTFPMVLFTGFSAFIGGVIYHSGYGLNFSYILASTFICLVVSFAVVYFSALILNEIANSFLSTRDKPSMMALVSYSCTAFFISYAAANLLNIPPLNSLLSLCGLYSVYILWTGLTPMTGTPSSVRLRFAGAAGLIMTGIYFAFRLLLEAMFKGALSGISG